MLAVYSCECNLVSFHICEDVIQGIPSGIQKRVEVDLTVQPFEFAKGLKLLNFPSQSLQVLKSSYLHYNHPFHASFHTGFNMLFLTLAIDLTSSFPIIGLRCLPKSIVSSTRDLTDV